MQNGYFTGNGSQCRGFKNPVLNQIVKVNRDVSRVIGMQLNLRNEQVNVGGRVY